LLARPYRRFGRFELLEQRSQHLHLLGLPIRHEGREPLQPHFCEPTQLFGAWSRERYPAGPPVDLIGQHLDQTQTLDLTHLPSDL